MGAAQHTELSGQLLSHSQWRISSSVFPWFQALVHFWNRRYSAVVWMWHGLRKATLTAPKVGRKEWIYWQHLVQVWGGEGRRRLYKQIGEKLLLTTQGVV